eukprot:6653238-Pyramimonas_sp.AAC.1
MSGSDDESIPDMAVYAADKSSKSSKSSNSRSAGSVRSELVIEGLEEESPKVRPPPETINPPTLKPSKGAAPRAPRCSPSATSRGK